MWSVNVMFLLLLCYACLSTGNGEIYFVSKNFYNVLHWDTVKTDFPGRVFYSVQYTRDLDDQYRVKEECQNITRLFCDLTAETPSRWDVRYRAKVLVNGSLLGITTNLYPFSDTILGAPILSTHATASSLHVKVTLPQGPNGVSLEEIINSSKNRVSKIEYILEITHPKWAVQKIQNETGQFDISVKHSQQSYCGYVVYKPTPVMGRSSSENTSFCIKMPDNPGMLLQWPLATAAVVTGFVIISVVCMCNYVKGGSLKRKPQALIITSSTCKQVLEHPDRNRILSELCFDTKRDQTAFNPIQEKENVCPSDFESYSPQNIPWQICRFNNDSALTTYEQTTSNVEDTSVHSSVIYSAVAVHVQMEDDEKSQQVADEDRVTSHSSLSSNGEQNWDEGGTIPTLISSDVPQLQPFDADEDNPLKQLVLNTERNFNGQLVFSSFWFRLENSTGDVVTQTNPEREPLFPGLIDCQDSSLLTSPQRSNSSDSTDSGCGSAINAPTNSYYNTSYHPSQAGVLELHEGCHITPSSDTIYESGYKKNGMLELPHKPASTDTCTTISPQIKDGEGGEILLGHWELQLQN